MNISLEQIAKTNQKTYQYIFDSEQEKLFRDTLSGMSEKSQKIVHEMLDWDWKNGRNPYIAGLRTYELPPLARRRR